MYKATLEVTGGKSITIDFAQNASEILLSQAIDFTKVVEDFEVWQKKKEEENAEVTSAEYFRGYLGFAIRAIQAFTANDKVGKLKTGKFFDHIVSLTTKNPDLLDKKSWEDTVLTLYANTFRVINTYKPELPTAGDCEFKVGRRTYVIPRTHRDSITGKIIFDSIPAGQAIEALEVMRAYNNNIDNDPNGSIRFTSLLKLIAVVSRRKTKGKIESFPTKEKDIQLMIDKRIREFAPRMTMDIALRIENFFLLGMTIYERTLDVHSFLIPQQK